MKIAQSLFRFYIDGSLHVALAVISLVGITALEFDLTLSVFLYLTVFFGTITGYNFIKFAEIAGVQHSNLTTRLKLLQLLSLLCFGLLVFSAFQLSKNTLLLLSVFSLLTFLYALPFAKQKKLRNFSGLKIFVVALVWAGVTVVLPVYSIHELTVDVWLTFVQRFLMVFVLTLPFEIRDLKQDPAYLKTIPQVFGLQKTKTLGISFLVLVILLEGFKDQITHCSLSILLFICMCIGWFLIQSKIKQSVYFASFWVESIPLIWYTALVLFCNFFL